MRPTHTTPDGRMWRIVRIKGALMAELVNVPPMKRLLTTDLHGMTPIGAP